MRENRSERSSSCGPGWHITWLDSLRCLSWYPGLAVFSRPRTGTRLPPPLQRAPANRRHGHTQKNTYPADSDSVIPLSSIASRTPLRLLVVKCTSLGLLLHWVPVNSPPFVALISVRPRLSIQQRRKGEDSRRATCRELYLHMARSGSPSYTTGCPTPSSSRFAFTIRTQ